MLYIYVFLPESEHVECRPPGQAMEVPDHNDVGYSRGPQGDTYRSRGQLQRHHTIQTCDDAYVSQSLMLLHIYYDGKKTNQTYWTGRKRMLWVIIAAGGCWVNFISCSGSGRPHVWDEPVGGEGAKLSSHVGHPQPDVADG